jgi:Putative prokaryotic signal transducing protein
MKRLLQAPNLALATLWADQLVSAGIDANVQRAYACGIVGEIPMDQALPEVWVLDDALHAQATTLLDEMRHQPHRHWLCHGCGETVDGPFDQCWNCGHSQPA